MRSQFLSLQKKKRGTGYVVPILIIHRVFPEMKERFVEER